VIASANYPFLN